MVDAVHRSDEDVDSAGCVDGEYVVRFLSQAAVISENRGRLQVHWGVSRESDSLQDDCGINRGTFIISDSHCGGEGPSPDMGENLRITGVDVPNGGIEPGCGLLFGVLK